MNQGETQAGTVLNLAGTLLDHGLNALFPPTCVLCGAPGVTGLDLCAGCRADLPINTPACPRCAKRLPVRLIEPSHEQQATDDRQALDRPAAMLCGTCRDDPPPFLRSHAALRYQGPVQHLIADLKFRGRLDLLRLLGHLLAQSIDASGQDRPDLILPVPLHPKRLRARGFNQSWELARILGRRLDIAIDDRTCRRIRNTAHQLGLERQQRLHNLEGAFAATRALDGQHLVVLDDVVTTGSTVSEIAQVLLGAGCARVDVWAVARTT